MHCQTLEQQAHAHNNDYTDLEALYCYATEDELVTDPMYRCEGGADYTDGECGHFGGMRRERLSNVCTYQRLAPRLAMIRWHSNITGETYARTTIQHHQLLMAASD